MYRLFITLFFCIIGKVALSGNQYGFYVWQRAWSEDVESQVNAELEAGTHELYILAGEHVPEAIRANEKVSLVFRLPVKKLESPKKSAAEIIEEAKKLKVSRIELDVDAPESKLDKYEELVREIRGTWRKDCGELYLGATFLPCHLKHKEMKSILSLLDEPIIQLHGIDPPRSRNEKWALMNRRTSLNAIKKARELDKRFKMALPTYAYVLLFNGDGSFKRLFAEGLEEEYLRLKDESMEIAAPDLKLLREIISAPDRLPIIWFRLPIKGKDRFALDRETIRILERGEEPKPKVEVEIVETTRNVFDIYATYHHQIPLKGVEVELDWGENKRGEIFLLNSSKVNSEEAYGDLPDTLFIAPFPCGQRTIIAKAIKELQ